MGTSTLKKGSGLEICIGENISIRSDNQILAITQFQPYNLANIDPTLTKVSQLIHANTKTWNSPLAHQNFNPDDVGCIFSIPLAHIPHKDCITWFPTKDGLYLVKRGHWFHNYLYSSEATSADQPSTSPVAIHKFWKTIWHGHQAHRLTYWVWQASWDKLSTKNNLSKRKFINNGQCLICTTHAETLIHILFECQNGPLPRNFFKYLSYQKIPSNILA